ncbi:MAG TPA: TAXI family TRAP transporter solute-binding subunit [Firmicutes bacterium]|nr:TAXI family TRAP transporter solute-binding subunit [Bacillota bacterium]
MTRKYKSLFVLLTLFIANIILFTGCGRKPEGHKDRVKQLNLAITAPGEEAVLFMQKLSEIYHERTHIPVSIETLLLEQTISSMREKNSDICFTSVNAATLAYWGRGRYEETGASPLRLVFYTSYKPIYIIVLRDSGIEGLADLKGKRIMGLKHTDVGVEQATRGFIELAGLNQDDIVMHFLVPEPHALACLEFKTADAVLIQTPLTSMTIRNATVLEKIKVIGVPAGKEEEIKSILGPGYDTLILNLDRLKESEAFTALIRRYAIYAREEVPEEIIYNFIKAYYENERVILEPVSDQRTWDIKEYLTVLQTVPFHDGAVRFLKEQGLWTEELARQQEALLKES